MISRKTEGNKKKKNRGSASAQLERHAPPVPNSLYLVDIDVSSALDEQLDVLVSLIIALPGQSSEQDLLEKIIDPPDSVRSEA